MGKRQSAERKKHSGRNTVHIKAAGQFSLSGCFWDKFRKELSALNYKYFLISEINASYSASDKNFSPGFIANTPPHSYSSLYFGTRWK